MIWSGFGRVLFLIDGGHLLGQLVTDICKVRKPRLRVGRGLGSGGVGGPRSGWASGGRRGRGRCSHWAFAALALLFVPLLIFHFFAFAFAFAFRCPSSLFFSSPSLFSFFFPSFSSLFLFFPFSLVLRLPKVTIPPGLQLDQDAQCSQQESHESQDERVMEAAELAEEPGGSPGSSQGCGQGYGKAFLDQGK